jgi:glycosyltransferase involved in cell wall biosynthesis
VTMPNAASPANPMSPVPVSNQDARRVPRVTIIVACINAAGVLGRCLASIAQQDYPNLEVVVSDGNSHDGTIEILKQFETHMGPKLKWASEPDTGIADAWNKAVDRSTGDWLLFLGADDSLANTDVVSGIAPFLTSTDRRVVYGSVRLRDRSGMAAGYWGQPWSPVEFRGCRLTLPHQATFHHRSLFTDHGRFDTSLRIASDYDFLLRELMHAEPLYLPNCIVSNMQTGGVSLSRRGAHRVVWEQMLLYRRYVHGFPVVLSWWLIKALGIAVLSRVGGEALALRVTNLYRRWVGGRAPLQY